MAGPSSADAAIVPRQASGGGGGSRSKRSGTGSSGGGGGLFGAIAAGLSARASALSAAVSELADRSNVRSRGYQDAAFHAALFASAVYAMHRWGHLLSV
jgi:hypothetical protein